MATYILPFGKFKGMYADKVAEIVVQNKYGNDEKVGMNYLKWLVQQPWFRHSDSIIYAIRKYDKTYDPQIKPEKLNEHKCSKFTMDSDEESSDDEEKEEEEKVPKKKQK